MKKRNITRNFVKMSNNLKKSTAMSIVEVAAVDSEKSNLSNDSNCKLVLNSKHKDREVTCFTAGGVGKLIVSAICGLCFGFILEKARGKSIEKYNQTCIKRSPFWAKRNSQTCIKRSSLGQKKK